MIKYIGSKRSLIPWILEVMIKISRSSGAKTVADLFSGSARVSHALKSRGFYVIANDFYHYAFTIAKALVEADRQEYPEERVKPILERLSQLPPKRGWFTETYCEEARFFQPKNGERIEAIREHIEEHYTHDPTLKAILLSSLILAADKVDSTTGVQMAYLKDWAPRSYNDLRLEYPPLLPGPGEALLGDAIEVVEQVEADILYLDPPYNQHSYLGNYHIWETLVLWDKPKTYGVARKREDVKYRKSHFNSRRLAKEALSRLLAKAKAPHIVLSFNNEGFFTAQEIEDLLKEWGYVVRLSRRHKRYIGAVIGIYNPKGEKVGVTSHTENTEFLFVATRSRKVYDEFVPLSKESVVQPSLF
ncbi:MAG: DNA adenine methylase [Candidatus Hadarchaeum sp.]|uniref:DNA adenine methylase n=1 Tax=Candidatus Hadarchaeum sp. TaxID=2883567 RepID=UPI003D0F9EDD